MYSTLDLVVKSNTKWEKTVVIFQNWTPTILNIKIKIFTNICHA